MKKSLLLVLAASAAIVLAGCGPTASSKASEDSATSSSVVYTKLEITNKADLQAEWHPHNDDRKLTLNIEPAANIASLLASGELTIASSDATIVSISGLFLSPLKEGKVTITLKLGTLTDSVELTIGAAVAPVIAEKTVKEANSYTKADNTVISVSGILASVTDKAKGYGYIMDPATGDSVYCYGLSSLATSLIKYDTGKGYYTGIFNNQQDFATNGATIGSYITVNGVIDVYKGKVEFMGAIVKEVKVGDAAYTYKYAATLAAPTNGTAVLDKTADLGFGDKVVVTPTAATGYVLDKIVVDHGIVGNETLVAVENVYSFNANVINKVTVTFKSNSTAKDSYVIATDSAGVPTAYTTDPVTVDGLSVYFINTDLYKGAISMGKAGNGNIHNAVATARAIKSVDVVIAGSYAPGKVLFATGSAKMDAQTSTTPVAISTKNTDGKYAYSFAPTAATDTFFFLSTYNDTSLSNQYNVTFASITVTMVAA